MARRNLYIPKADEKMVRRWERELKKQRTSLSEWFMRVIIDAMSKAEQERGNGK